MTNEGTRLLVCFGLPHPAVRVAVDHMTRLAKALTAGADVQLRLSHEAQPWRARTAERAMMLKWSPMAAASLVARWEPGPLAHLRAAGRLAAELNATHRLLPTLSLEAAIGSPATALSFLADMLALPISSQAVAMAGDDHPRFLRTIKPLIHPAAFLDGCAVEASIGPADDALEAIATGEEQSQAAAMHAIEQRAEHGGATCAYRVSGSGWSALPDIMGTE